MRIVTFIAERSTIPAKLEIRRRPRLLGSPADSAPGRPRLGRMGEPGDDQAEREERRRCQHARRDRHRRAGGAKPAEAGLASVSGTSGTVGEDPDRPRGAETGARIDPKDGLPGGSDGRNGDWRKQDYGGLEGRAVPERDIRANGFGSVGWWNSVDGRQMWIEPESDRSPLEGCPTGSCRADGARD
jgi:hypothetical protein